MCEGVSSWRPNPKSYKPIEIDDDDLAIPVPRNSNKYPAAPSNFYFYSFFFGVFFMCIFLLLLKKNTFNCLFANIYLFFELHDILI